MKAFISHAADDLIWAQAVSRAMGALDIGVFLAHESIAVSEPWKARIIEEIAKADIFVAILSRKFRASEWCAQEVGMAVARGVSSIRLIGIALDSRRSYGFLGDAQIARVTSEQELDEALSQAIYLKEPRRIIPTQIARLRAASSPVSAARALRPLAKHAMAMEAAEVHDFFAAIQSNEHLFYSEECCSDLIPHALEVHRLKLDAHVYSVMLARTRRARGNDTWAA